MPLYARILAQKPPNIAWGVTFAAIAAYLLKPVALHMPLPAVGFVTGLAGVLLLLRAWWLFRSADIGIRPTDPTESLVLDDVFGLSRHPMYLGMLTMLLGVALATGALSFYLAAALLWAILDVVFCRFEEAKLVRRFGLPYRRYMDRVRRWL